MRRQAGYKEQRNEREVATLWYRCTTLRWLQINTALALELQ